jgi:hypothetical protein
VDFSYAHNIKAQNQESTNSSGRLNNLNEYSNSKANGKLN